MEHDTRLLLVEDDVIVAADLRRIIEEAGYDVIGLARHGEQAISMADRLEPDLILMDVRLPGTLDGIDTMCAIRERRRVGVVYVSAYADPALVDRAVALGAAGYIVKPFVRAQIVSALKVAVSLRQLAIERVDASAGDADVWKSMAASVDRLVRRRAPGTHKVPSPSASRAVLSPREAELARALIYYRHVSLAADVLGISLHTARNHLKSIFRKLDVHSQDELYRLLMQLACVSAPDVGKEPYQ